MCRERAGAAFRDKIHYIATLYNVTQSCNTQVKL